MDVDTNRTPHLHQNIHVRNRWEEIKFYELGLLLFIEMNIPLPWKTLIKYMTKLQLLQLPHHKAQAWGIITV